MSVQQKRVMLAATGHVPEPRTPRPTAATLRVASAGAARDRAAGAAAANVAAAATGDRRASVAIAAAASRPTATAALAADVEAAGVRAAESALRRAVHTGRAYFDTERRLLLGRLRAADASGGGALTAGELATAAAKLGAPGVTPASAAAILRAHPDLVTADGRLSYAPYAERLLAPYAFAARGGVCRGYPSTDAHFAQKIVYPKCRTGVYAPSDWACSDADRSAGPVDARLRPQFAYGVAGASAAAPLAATATGELVFFTAGLGVVFDPRSRRQRFFGGHNDDIACLSLCPYGFDAQLCSVPRGKDRPYPELGCPDGRDYPPGTLVATGQVKKADTGVGPPERPALLVWDTRDGRQLARIDHCAEDRAVIVASFAPHGRWLATVGSDNGHSVYVWDWRLAERLRRRAASAPPVPGTLPVLFEAWSTRAKLGEGKGYQGTPPAVHGIAWNGAAAAPEFVTYGTLHVKRFWCADGVWSNKLLSYGSLPRVTACSAVFLPPPRGRESILVVGTPHGHMYIFKGDVGVRCITGAHPPPAGWAPPRGGAIDPDHGLRCLVLTPDGKRLLSGGDDGAVRAWEVTPEGDVSEVVPKSGNVVTAAPRPFESEPPAGVRSIDVLAVTAGGVPGAGAGAGPSAGGGGGGAHPLAVVFTTSAGDCWIAEPGARRPTLAMAGHAGDVDGLCWHPTETTTFVTACGSGRASVWCADRRMLLRAAQLGMPLTCVDVSPVTIGGAGHHIAVGSGTGRLAVLDCRTLQPLYQDSPCEPVSLCDVRYAPGGASLAACGHDRCVHIWRTSGGAPEDSGYTRTHRLVGHSATVRQLDWAVDGRHIHSCCSGYEVMHWDAGTGTRVPDSMRDATWATWTCVLGFPVMGIWPPGSDGTDVNAACRSSHGRHVAVGDDYGAVRVLAYPCVAQGAPCASAAGHSAAVERVRFSPDDALLLSAGGRDRTVLQLETHNVAACPPGGAAMPVDWCDLPEGVCGWCRRPVPPPPPPLVWGPLDTEGKAWGFTVSPAVLSDAAKAVLAASEA